MYDFYDVVVSFAWLFAIWHAIAACSMALQ